MPNWCAGNIRFRGKKEDIKRFLEENIIFCISELKDNTVATLEKPAIVELDDDYGFILISPWEDWKHSWIYIKDTHRNFLNLFETAERNYPVQFIQNENNRCVVVFDNFRAAWNIDPEPYLEHAKNYNIDIRIVGFEQGGGFDQDIIIENGELTRNRCKNYGDYYYYLWESTMPYMGG